MALFVAICTDVTGGLDLRLAAREAHLAHAGSQPAGFIRLGGPFLDEEGRMCGSLIVFDAETRAAVDAFFEADPYVRAGVFESVDIRPWRATMPWT